MNAEVLIPVQQAADRLGVTTATIRNWIRRGEILADYVDGRRCVVWSSVERAIARLPMLGIRGRPTALAQAYRMNRPAEPTEPLEVRIESRIKKEDGENGCWLWTGNMTKGRATYNAHVGDRINVRSWMYHRLRGKTGDLLKPACGRSACVRPEHMKVLGAKLSLSDVEKIKKRWATHLAHKTSLPALASEYGVTRQRIEQIVREVKGAECSQCQ